MQAEQSPVETRIQLCSVRESKTIKILSLLSSEKALRAVKERALSARLVKAMVVALIPS